MFNAGCYFCTYLHHTLTIGDDIMIRAACYVRVSTDNQLENYSIEEQTDRLQAFCKAKDITVVKMYTDGGYSGGNINRPALHQMLSDIETGNIDVVVVYKLDRLSRSQKDTLMLIEDYFLKNNVDFISVNENFDTSTPFGRAMIGILSVFAQLEKDQITERFTMGRIGRAKNGYFHGGGYAPTGYDYKDGNLIVNEYEALQVRELYERFEKGYSIHNCWKYMQSKYVTKYGGWKSETLIRNVLRNELYIGKVKFGGNLYPGQHQPIIPEELFYKVQSIMDNRRKDSNTSGRSPFKASTLLSGFIYCGKCGARFHGEHGNYSCYSRTKGDKKYIVDPNCKNKKWKIPDLDAVVTDYICHFEFESLEKEAVNDVPAPDYSKRITEIDKQIGRMLDLYQLGSIPIDIISKKVDDLYKEKETLQTAEIPQQRHISIEELLQARDKFISVLNGGSLEEKRACLSLLIKRIEIDDDKVNIILNEL